MNAGGVPAPYLQPSHGGTYIGLYSTNCSTLDNFKESVGQRLGTMLRSNGDYYFFVDIATVIGGDLNTSSRLRVYAGSGLNCDSSQVIYTSTFADTFWRREIVQFRLTADADYITLGCTSISRPDPPCTYRGYLFIDNLSPIYQGIYTGITPGSEGEETEVMAYPNPTSGPLIFTGPTLSGNAAVYDMIGRQVAMMPVLNGHLDISGLPNGVYFLELGNDGASLNEGNEVVKRVKVILAK